MSLRILMVDDNREIVRLVRTYLEESNYEVLVAYDGETALHILRRERPDLVLLGCTGAACCAPDLLPERDSRDATHAVRHDTNLVAMPIIILTARVNDHDEIVGLELAADDDAGRPFNPREVVAKVRAALRNVQGETNAPKVIQVGEMTIDLDTRKVATHGELVHLTPTEFALLRALAEQPGHALTRQEMIENGLGFSYEGLERTVDSHVKNLRRKLDGTGDNACLIETVFGVGYRLAAEDDRS
jgi:two-component system alkaline phosphatase synthesis response regulator PhoP